MRTNQEIVLAGLIPHVSAKGVSSHLDILLHSGVNATYFDKGAPRLLFESCMNAGLMNTPLDKEIIGVYGKNLGYNDTEIFDTVVLFEDLAKVSVTREKMKVVLPAFKDERHSDKFFKFLEDAATILSDGMKVGNEELKGYGAAKKHLMYSIAQMEQGDTKVLPTKELSESADDVLKEYEDSKANKSRGIYTGFREIDRLTNGIQKSELWIVCGYTAEGKSISLLNMAYYASVFEKKNVVYVSLEMPLQQVQRRLITRHTNHPKFKVPGGLNYNDIKRGQLSPEGESFFKTVVRDYAESNYGKMTIMQVTKSETVQTISERLMYLRTQHPIDLVVLDYASLLSTHRRRSERRDEIVEVIEGLKALCMTFNDGEGLAMLTANQISRKAREEAGNTQSYGINFASETSAIEKNADFLAWILRTDAMKAAKEVKMGIAKYRDGDVGREFMLLERYESGLLADIII